MTQWYLAGSDKNVLGPLDEENLIRELVLRSDAASVPVWKPGFPDWVQAGSVAELAAKIQQGPPPLQPRHFDKNVSKVDDKDYFQPSILVKIIKYFPNVELSNIWPLSLVAIIAFVILVFPFGYVTFAVKLLDPVIFVPALIGGFVLKRNWQIALLSLVVGFLQESLLVSTQYTRSFQYHSFVVAVVAAAAIATLCGFVRRKWRTPASTASSGAAANKGVWDQASTAAGKMILWSVVAMMFLMVGIVVTAIASR